MNELFTASVSESVTAIITAFGLIGLAEIGDKSQLVCMTLAGSLAPLPDRKSVV